MGATFNNIDVGERLAWSPNPDAIDLTANFRTIALTDRDVRSGAQDRVLAQGIDMYRYRCDRTQLTLVRQRMTGEKMLAVLEKMCIELDELGICADVVSCPHTYRPRSDQKQLMYLGKRLDFCTECHRLVHVEFVKMNLVFGVEGLPDANGHSSRVVPEPASAGSSP